MSTLAVNSITDANAGNTATINSYTPTESNMAGRNRIINGCMRIDQRNAGASVTLTNGSDTFSLDRYKFYRDVGGTFTAQQSTTAPAGFTNSLLVTASTGASPSSAQLNFFQQIIEGFNAADLAWGTASAKTVTLSFWVRSSVTGTYSAAFSNSALGRAYVATFDIASANTFEYKTITIPGDTSGTWLTNNGIGLRVYFDLGSGSNYNLTAGSWGGTWGTRTSGSVTWGATNGATFYITGVQLEVGSVATPFERRPYGTELFLCQRYYEKNNAGTTNGAFVMGYSTANNAANYVWFYKVTKRAAATISVSGATHFWGQTGAGSNVSTTSLGGQLSGINQTSLSAGFGGTSFTIGQGSQLVDNNSGNSWIAASAEL